MGIFNRQTMDQITQKMIDWSRGVTSQLTDWRVGSKNRTMYEAVAIVLEDFYDKTFKAVKNAVLQNIYTALGFAPIPAINATGTVRFYAQNAPSSTAPFLIPMGTQVQAAPSASTPPITFQTTQDVSLVYNSPTEAGSVTIGGVSMTGWYYVDVPVVCTQGGIIGNVGANTIQTLIGAPAGIGACNNGVAVASGQDAETLSQQKSRFQSFVRSLTRGTLDSINYAASTAVVMDPTGTFIQELVKSVVGVDGNGTFSVYLWNGVGAATQLPTTSTASSGTPNPGTAPTLAATTPAPATNFTAGSYYVGYTIEDLTGETAGSPVSSAVTLTIGQGINATVGTIPAGAAYINFYVGTSPSSLVWVQSTPVTSGMSTTIAINGNTPYSCSRKLVRKAQQIISGYTDPNTGNRVWGFKPAGIPYTLGSVTVLTVNLAMTVTPLAGYGVTNADVANGMIDLRPAIQNAISAYFSALVPGQTAVWSALEAVIKQVQGVYDVSLTTPSGNTTATQTQILVPSQTITYTKGTTV